MSEQNSLSLSFLDVLSCSLGASILLFLIFSTLEHEGARDSQAQTGLPLEAKAAQLGEPASKLIKTPALFTIDIVSADDADSVKGIPETCMKSDEGWQVSLDRSVRGKGNRGRRFLLFMADRTAEGTLDVSVESRVVMTVRQVGGGRDGEPKEFEIQGNAKLPYRAGTWGRR